MKNVVIVVIATVCVTSTSTAQQIDQNLFRNFTVMKLPQREVPVGAKWLPGLGPSGPATDRSNIITSQSVSSAAINSSLKRELSFSLGTFLGLSGNQAEAIEAQFSDLKIDRVADFTKLRGVVAGDQVLYLALRAGKISIKTNADGAAGLKAAADAKSVPVSLSASKEGSTIVNVDGNDLYIAYQVLSLGKPQIRQTSVGHDGNEATLLGTYRFRFCQCKPGSRLTIEWQNLRNVGMAGEIETKRIEHHPEVDRLKEYPLDSYFSGDTVTAARVLFRYHAEQDCFGKIRNGGTESDICTARKFPKNDNKIVLTTTSFRLTPVQRPEGQF